MPPIIKGSRVPIGGGAIGAGANMKNAAGSRDSKTFEGASSSGRKAGGPQQKGGVPGATGERVGGGGETSQPSNRGVGLKGTIKSGRSVSPKPQPEASTQGRY